MMFEWLQKYFQKYWYRLLCNTFVTKYWQYCCQYFLLLTLLLLLALLFNSIANNTTIKLNLRLPCSTRKIYRQGYNCILDTTGRFNNVHDEGNSTRIVGHRLFSFRQLKSSSTPPRRDGLLSF